MTGLFTVIIFVCVCVCVLCQECIRERMDSKDMHAYNSFTCKINTYNYS